MSDLISREYIPYIDLNGDMPQSKVRVWVAFKEQIDALPSADRSTGKWVLEEYKSHNHIENFYICSSCRNFEAWGKTELYNYCPNCGAKMYKGGESNG